jgi:hypothetical protein
MDKGKRQLNAGTRPYGQYVFYLYKKNQNLGKKEKAGIFYKCGK